MLKYFTISLVLLSLLFAGCSSKSPEPQVVEEEPVVEEEKTAVVEEETAVEISPEEENKLDLEHQINIEEQEKLQEEKITELLTQESVAETEDSAPASTESLLVAEAEQETQEVIQPELQNDESDSSAEILPATEPKSQEPPVEETQTDGTPAEETQTEEAVQEIIEETVQVVVTEATEETVVEAAQSRAEKVQTQETQSETVEDSVAEETKKTTPDVVAIIVSPQVEPKPDLFIPEAPLALSSANRLVSCSKVPELMAAIHQRLLKTKELDIADRRLRDKTNDRLMPVIHFDFDKIVIKTDYIKLLRQQSSCVLKNVESRGDMIIQIEGHADERGSDEYNMALGHRRANSVSNAILAYLTDSSLAQIFSFGEEYPLVSESNKNAWAQNRRVEFTLLLKP